MADPFVNLLQTYDRVITDERDGEKWTVTYRPLSAGDRAMLQDLARMSTAQDGEGAGSAEMRLGAAQMMTLERAIISWTLPLSKTKTTIESLHPDLFDQMFQHISWGSPEEEPDEVEEAERPLPESNATSEEPAEPQPAAVS